MNNYDDALPAQPRKGRGAISNPDGRFESQTHRVIDDGWGIVDDEILAPPKVRTTLTSDKSRSVVPQRVAGCRLFAIDQSVPRL